MRKQQDHRGYHQDLVIAVLEVEHQVTVLAELQHCPQEKRSPDNQSLACQQDQRTDRIIDIEEADHALPLACTLCAGTPISSVVVLVIRLRSGFDAIQDYPNHVLVLELLPGLPGN